VASVGPGVSTGSVGPGIVAGDGGHDVRPLYARKPAATAEAPTPSAAPEQHQNNTGPGWTGSSSGGSSAALAAWRLP
jgi:hypothetical protein